MPLIHQTYKNDRFNYPIKKLVTFEMQELLDDYWITLNQYNIPDRLQRMVKFLYNLGKAVFGYDKSEFTYNGCVSYINWRYFRRN